MPVIPLVLIIAGYWVMYSGVKQVSLIDAFRCAAAIQQTPVPEPGSNVRRMTPPPPVGVAQANPNPNPRLVPGLLPTPRPGGFIQWPPPTIRNPFPPPAPRPQPGGLLGGLGSWLNGLLGAVGL